MATRTNLCETAVKDASKSLGSTGGGRRDGLSTCSRLKRVFCDASRANPLGVLLWLTLTVIRGRTTFDDLAADQSRLLHVLCLGLTISFKFIYTCPFPAGRFLRTAMNPTPLLISSSLTNHLHPLPATPPRVHPSSVPRTTRQKLRASLYPRKFVVTRFTDSSFLPAIRHRREVTPWFTLCGTPDRCLSCWHSGKGLLLTCLRGDKFWTKLLRSWK